MVMPNDPGVLGGPGWLGAPPQQVPPVGPGQSLPSGRASLGSGLNLNVNPAYSLGNVGYYPYAGSATSYTDPTAAAYNYGLTNIPSNMIRAFTSTLAPEQQQAFEEITRLSGGQRFGSADPLRSHLYPEVAQAIEARAAMVPFQIGQAALYGPSVRATQEAASPELAASREFIMSRLQEGIPEDMLASYQQDIRRAQASRGMSYGQDAAIDEAMRLTQIREAQRQNLLGPAMTLGLQTAAQAGLTSQSQFGTVGFAPVGAERWQQQEQDWAELGTWLDLGASAFGSGTGALATLFSGGI